MIKFFRKVRQKMLTENKFSKYLLYAIGEIILVVIGILIALQVNNWNEQRKEAKKETYYLERLKDDFLFNKNEANRNISFSNFQNGNAHLLIKSLYEPLDNEESIRWFIALNHVWFLPHPSYTTSTWDELKSTGNLNIFTNKYLLKKITDFYSLLDAVNKYEDEWAAFNLEYRNKVNNVLNDSLRQMFLENLVETGDFEFPKQAPNPKAFILKLKAIDGIEGLISDIRINRDVGGKFNHGKLKLQIIDIIETLKEELNK